MTEHIDKKISMQELEIGFKRQTEQIVDLLFAANDLYFNKLYNISIALSILAIEELTKLRAIRDSDYLYGEMEFDNWKKLISGQSVHIKKLNKPIEEMLVRHKEKDSKHWKLVNDFVNSTLKSGGGEKTERTVTTKIDFEMHYALNQLKQACLYLDFKDKKWFSAKTFFSKKELEALAYTNLKIAEFNFNEIQLHNKHREIEINKNSESYKAYVNDPLFKKRVDFQKLSKSSEFLKKRILSQSALEKLKPKKG